MDKVWTDLNFFIKVGIDNRINKISYNFDYHVFMNYNLSVINGQNIDWTNSILEESSI